MKEGRKKTLKNKTNIETGLLSLPVFGNIFNLFLLVSTFNYHLTYNTPNCTDVMCVIFSNWLKLI